MLLLLGNKWVRAAGKGRAREVGPEIIYGIFSRHLMVEGQRGDLVTQIHQVSTLQTYMQMLDAHGHCGFWIVDSVSSHACVISILLFFKIRVIMTKPTI